MQKYFWRKKKIPFFCDLFRLGAPLMNSGGKNRCTYRVLESTTNSRVGEAGGSLKWLLHVAGGGGGSWGGA